MPPQGRNPAEVYNDIRANMDNDPLHLSPISCQSPTYGEDVYQYPNNQSPEREHQEALFRDLWVIMRHYQTFIQRPVYDPPGEGNCGYYALAHALGFTSHDAHLKVRNDLLTELVNHRDDYVKLHSHGTKRRTRNRAQIVQDQAKIELDVFESRLKHGGITAPRRKWFDSQMGFIVASAYARPFVILGDEPAGCMFYLPYRHRPSTKSPIIVGFIKGVHFVQMDPKEGQFFFLFSSGSYGLLTFLWGSRYHTFPTCSSSLGRQCKVCFKVVGTGSAWLEYVDGPLFSKGKRKWKR